MPKRIATQTIVFVRDGKRITVKPKQSFDFSKPEIDQITALSKDALRQPINESESIVELKLPESKVAAEGGITNLNDTAANPDASVPAPLGKATSPTTGSKSNPKPAAPGKSDEEL